jgi:hypothetical protein
LIMLSSPFFHNSLLVRFLYLSYNKINSNDSVPS